VAAVAHDDDDLELERTLAELVGLLPDHETFEATLRRVAELSVRTIPGCVSASVTVLTDGGAGTTAAASDDRSLRVDEAQYSYGGPCLDAARTGETYDVPSIADERRWGEYPAAALRCGVSSSLSLPLTVHGASIGALNLYGGTAAAFGTEAHGTAALFAVQAAVAIANARVVETSRRLTSQMREAMSARAVIEQAKGILMAERSCDDEVAFDLLRTASQRQNVKLRDVAQGLVASKVRAAHNVPE
jgi:GAF domain-containing protein